MSSVLDETQVVKQGWLENKEGWIFGSLRSRWIVLTAEYLYIFHNDDINKATMESIKLCEIKSIASASDLTFNIECDNNYEFKAKTDLEKTEWIDMIQKYKQCIKIPIIVICHRMNDYNCNFQVTVPYNTNYPYSVNELIMKIINYINKKYPPFRFFATKIRSDSFIGHEINYIDSDWRESSNLNITDYVKAVLEEIGMKLEIDMKIYQHNIILYDNLCEDMKDDTELCPIYAEMRYQDIFSEQYLNHLYDYRHPDDTECKFGDQCYAFKRIEEGGNELNDRAHITIYKHPPRRATTKTNQMAEDINSFCLNDEWVDNIPLYRPSDEDKEKSDYNEQDGFLKLLIKEVIDNGYKSDLCLAADGEENNNYTLIHVVDQKLKCMRHKLMGLPLNKSEMLSILLYTGCHCTSDLCKSQRNGDYQKWKWFDYCLYHAIHKLSKREHGSYKIYTGLASTQLTDKYVQCGYFKTFVSTSWMKHVAITFADDKGMIFEMDETFREKAICCDVSWISKFGRNECEVLIARSIDAVLNNFECKIIDQTNGIQTVSLRLYGETKRKQQSQVKFFLFSKAALEVIKLKNTEKHKSNASQMSMKKHCIKQEDSSHDSASLTRSVVNGFIRRIEQKYYVPIEIFHIICLFCGPMRKYRIHGGITKTQMIMRIGLHSLDYKIWQHSRHYCTAIPLFQILQTERSNVDAYVNNANSTVGIAAVSWLKDVVIESYRYWFDNKQDITLNEVKDNMLHSFASHIGSCAGAIPGYYIGWKIFQKHKIPGYGPLVLITGNIIGTIISSYIVEKSWNTYKHHQATRYKVERALNYFDFKESDMKNSEMFNEKELLRRYDNLKIHHIDKSGSNDEMGEINEALRILLHAVYVRDHDKDVST